jgi:hypothetical protein
VVAAASHQAAAEASSSAALTARASSSLSRSAPFETDRADPDPALSITRCVNGFRSDSSTRGRCRDEGPSRGGGHARRAAAASASFPAPTHLPS